MHTRREHRHTPNQLFIVLSTCTSGTITHGTARGEVVVLTPTEHVHLVRFRSLSQHDIVATCLQTHSSPLVLMDLLLSGTALREAKECDTYWCGADCTSF